MIGVVVLPEGPLDVMHGLDAEQTSCLLTLGDRPVLQHCVELLLSQGATAIHLVVSQAPDKVEALLGDGRRWERPFQVHLIRDAQTPYRVLDLVPDFKANPVALVHADLFPCCAMAAADELAPIFYRLNAGEGSAASPAFAAYFPQGFGTLSFADSTAAQLPGLLLEEFPAAKKIAVAEAQWVDLTTPAKLLETQRRFLSKQLPGLQLSGTELKPSVWVGRDVAISPEAELIAPVYIGAESRIGAGARIGPNAVVGQECIIERHSLITDSLILSATFVGESLEVDHCIANKDLLVDTRHDTGLRGLEEFMMGDARLPRASERLLQLAHSIVAVLLLVVLSPLWLLLFLYWVGLRRQSSTQNTVVKLPAGNGRISQRTYLLTGFGKDSWKTPHAAGWNVLGREFLPGLMAVMAGDLRLVGLPPHTPEAIEAMPPEWRAAYLKGVAGLIQESHIAQIDRNDPLQVEMTDRYYLAKRSPLYDLRLAFLFFVRLLWSR